MLHMNVIELERIDPGRVATFVLGALVSAMSAAVGVLLYLPLR